MNKVCSDFDEDCNGVESPMNCWLGFPPYFSTLFGEIIYMPVADGYCPLIRQGQEKDASESVILCDSHD